MPHLILEENRRPRALQSFPGCKCLHQQQQMHPTLELLLHSSSSVCAACFTDWKGAYAYASQAVLAL